MANLQRQIRRDTTGNIAAYTLAQGELGYDTARGNLVAGDGATAGGGSLFPPLQTGTWMPTIAGATIAGTPTYTRQSGAYVKIGSLVMAWFEVAISALGGMSGVIEIGGLAFASLAEANPTFGGSLHEYDGITFDSGYSQLLLEFPNLSETYFYATEAGSGKSAQTIAASNLAAALTLSGHVKYLTAY